MHSPGFVNGQITSKFNKRTDMKKETQIAIESHAALATKFAAQLEVKKMDALGLLAREVSECRKSQGLSREQLAAILGMGRGGRTSLEVAENPTPARHMSVGYMTDLLACLERLAANPVPVFRPTGRGGMVQ